MICNQTRKRRALRLFFLILSIIFLTACGSGESPPTGPGTNKGSIIFKLVWQNAAPKAHEGPPSGNACDDYGIKTINAVITDKENKTEYKGSWSCKELSGTIKEVTEGAGYTIAVVGLVACNADWQGQLTDFTVKKNTTNVAGPILMAYYGDDTTPPKVTTHYPGVGDTDIYLNSAISVNLSENVVAGSLNSTSCRLVENGTTTQVPSDISYDSESLVAIMTPKNDLKALAEYTVTINSSVVDLAGLHLAPDTTWTFTTGPNKGEFLMWNTYDWNASLWN